MSRTAVLTKKQIIQCAFDIANKKGKAAITIREIANQLGKSTAPIYTQYASIDAIFNDLLKYIGEQVVESTQQKRTVSPFLNIGVGFLAFVIDNKLIFNDFFLTMDAPLYNIKHSDHSYLDQMRENPFISVFSDDQLETILYDMQVYTYGLATMICTNVDGDHDLSYYQNKLEISGNSLMSYHLYSSGKYETVIKKIFEKIGKHIDIEEVLK
jgi:AcrR family transcriptional regulator